MATPIRYERHVLGPIELPEEHAFGRADLEIYGINHFRPSYTALVFFNDPKLRTSSASRDRPGYAGSFSIFGHARCSGDEGHCTVHDHLRRFDDRPSHPLTRAFKRVTVTAALRDVYAGGAREVTITLIVAAPEDPEHASASLFECQGMQIATFD
jgi:hypothetical protein